MVYKNETSMHREITRWNLRRLLRMSLICSTVSIAPLPCTIHAADDSDAVAQANRPLPILRW